MIHSDFVHLHVHSQYSLLDGACLISNLIDLSLEYRMPALALTDHGNMFGAIEFYTQAMSKGIKPIIGCEVYVAPGSRFEKSSHGIQEASFHLILLSRDEMGYKNLLKLVSLGYLEGFYYRPRVDKELLSQHSKGLIALTSCLQGEIPYLIAKGKYEEAKEVASHYKDIFGTGNFYLELQENLIPEQDIVNKGILVLAKELDIPIVATADVHYISKRDARAHEALLCIQTQTTLDDPNHMRFQTDEFYFKSPDEMKQLFAELPQAISSTLEIAEKCNLELEFDKTHLPHYNPPAGRTRDEYLRELTEDGLKVRYRVIDETVRNRVEHELKIIKDTGFTSYFLIAWDFIHYAKSKGIPVGPGRGSAAGSVVSYALGITDLDPLKYDLIFERFLNPDRVSLPDIDIDFCYERRGEVINYVVEKYSKDNVAQVITFGTMQARAAIRDVGRVMGLSYGEVDRIAKLVPPDLNITLEEAINKEPQLRNLYKGDAKITQLIETSLALEGLTRHASTHAAGVVISDEPLTNYIPLFKASEDQISTGYSMSSLEKMGLLKMDFLGLRTLTVIDETTKIIKRTKGIEINIENIPMDDPKTFALLSRAESLGVFQLESTGMRELLRKLRPNKFEDIVAILALYRPGPIGSGMVDDFIKRKDGQVPIKYDHKLLEPILKETYGIIVYQEQVMRIASDLAGFTMSQADSLRRAMSKKTPEVMEQARSSFIEGATKKGIEKRTAEKVFNLIEYFAGYGFNKCVIGSTEIIDSDTGKIVTVKELFDNKNIINSTLSCDDNLKIVKAKIKDVVYNGVKAVYKLKTALGKEIVATSNHPFLTFRGWKNLGDLSIRERIALPKTIPINGGSRLESNKIIALAWILSEGNTCHTSGIYYYTNDKSQVDDFVKSAEEFDNTAPRVTKRRGRFEVYVGTGKDTRFSRGHVPWNKGVNKDNYDGVVTLMSKERCGLRVWIEELGLDYKKATEKFIPKEIFCLDKELLALFLGRLWSGDGFICSGNNTIPFYSTSSQKLCQQVQNLLLRFGICSRIAKKTFKYKYKNTNRVKFGYALYLYGYESIVNFIHNICPFVLGKDKQINELMSYYRRVSPNLETKDTLPSEIKQAVRAEKERCGLTWRDLERKTEVSMREFCGGLKSHKKGFRRNTILKLAQFFESPRLLRYVNSDIVWDRVVSIEYAGMEQTYDIEIEGIHNFIANGIIVHNSHSTAYALISYRTAYLKANYPVEFITALLTSERDNIEKVAFYIEETQRMGIKVLPPDVNESFAKFTVVSDAIRFGLSAIKNVGGGAIDSIINARNRVGKFKSLYELCEHVDLRLVNRKVLESMIKCGAMDTYGLRRAQLMAILDDCLETASVLHKERQNGQLSFFSEFGSHVKIHTRKREIPNVAEWPENQLLAYEKEMLGFYLTGHPLAKYEKLLKAYVTTTIKELSKKRADEEAVLGGIIAKVKFTTTKKNEKMAIMNLEDLSGQTEVLVFPNAYKSTEKFIRKDAIVCIKGRVNLREEKPKLVANDIIPLEELQQKYTQAIIINLTTTGIDEKSLTVLKSILESHPGKIPVYLNFKMADGKKVEVSVEEKLKVRPSDELAGEIEKLLGEGTVLFKAWG